MQIPQARGQVIFTLRRRVLEEGSWFLWANTRRHRARKEKKKKRKSYASNMPGRVLEVWLLKEGRGDYPGWGNSTPRGDLRVNVCNAKTFSTHKLACAWTFILLLNLTSVGGPKNFHPLSHTHTHTHILSTTHTHIQTQNEKESRVINLKLLSWLSCLFVAILALKFLS